jgi:hypothetical protein
LEESKAFSADVCSGNRGDRLPLGNMVEANTDSESLECIDGSGGHYHDYGVLLWQVFRSGPVTGMRVQGAIAAYLLLAFGWSHAYRIGALVEPNAFNAAGTDVSVAIHWVNYSFGMLTTLGYAGIVPTDPVAHTLCSAEAVTGQLYLAVLVARLVSMHISAEEQSKQERSAGRPSNQSLD